MHTKFLKTFQNLNKSRSVSLAKPRSTKIDKGSFVANVYTDKDAMKRDIETVGLPVEYFNTYINEKKLSNFSLLNESGLGFWYTMNMETASTAVQRRKKFREACEFFVSTAVSQKASSAVFRLHSEDAMDLKQTLVYLEYLNHKFTWLKKEEEKDLFIDNIVLETSVELPDDELSKLNAAFNAKNVARDMLNMRSDSMTPQSFIDIAKMFAEQANLPFKSFVDSQLADEGLNLIYNVGKGSVHHPGMLVIEYKGDQASDKYTGLIGKGVTYDTGGYNIKPSGFMEDMHTDKGGACATFGAFCAIVNHKLPVNVVLCIPLADNAVDGKAYKPGEIIKSHFGLSVEITNTDAEGRLLLCDAMSYVQSKYNTSHIIELSTLTGAVIAALDRDHAGLFSNDEEIISDMKNSGQLYGEDVWHMPLSDKISNRLKGGVSDLVNSSRNKYGGAIEAAEYLHYFVKDGVKWAHVDIAGMAIDDTIKYNKGNKPVGSGFGVGLLIDYFTKMSSKSN